MKIRKINLIVFVLFFVVVQGYFIILSTQHALHNMPATCPVCALVNQFDSSPVNATVSIPVVIARLYFTLPVKFVAPVFRFVYYDSRAPPKK